MSNRINSKDINLMLSYKTYNNKDKSSPLKRLGIIFICLILIGGIVFVGYIYQSKRLNLQNEIVELENYINDEENILLNSKNSELLSQLENVTAKVDEINQALTVRENSLKVNNAIINEIISSIGTNDKITSLVYDRNTRSLNVSFSLTGEISTYDIIRNLKAKTHFETVQYNTYKYDIDKSLYQMSVSILLTNGKE